MYTKTFTFAILSLFSLTSAIATPAKGSAAADKAAIEAKVDTPCTGQNGTPVFGNGQGSCVCVSGNTVCSDASGATFN
jgi:hypothetical protein